MNLVVLVWIFAYKHFFHYISDFNLIFMWKLQPPLKNVTSSKSWGPVKPPFLKIWFEAQTPLQRGGAHYVVWQPNNNQKNKLRTIVCKIQANGGSDHFRIIFFFIYVRDFHERKLTKKIVFNNFIPYSFYGHVKLPLATIRFQNML